MIELEQMVVEVQQHFDAPPARVFALLHDVERMAGLGPEHRSAAWTGPTTFTGVNRIEERDRTWEVQCFVIADAAPYAFAWTVGPPDNPSSTWTYSLEGAGAGTFVMQRFQHGPGMSQLRHYCELEPDKAASFVQWRTERLRDNMTTVLSAAQYQLSQR